MLKKTVSVKTNVKRLLLIVFFILSVLNKKGVAGSRILAVFPSPARSHQIVFRALTNALLERGHSLTILSPDIIKSNNPNLTQIDLSSSYEIINRDWNVAEIREKDVSILTFARLLVKTSHQIMEAQLSNYGVQAMINNRDEYFDLVIVELIGFTPVLAFGEYYNAPVIGISSLDSYHCGHEAVGNVFNPIAHPELILKKQHNLNLYDRMFSVITMLYIKFVQFPQQYAAFDKLTQKYFGKNTSSSFELNKNIDLLFINTNPALGFVRPLVPKTIQLGFLHIRPPQPLPNELQHYLDNSKNGVIYVSFGTIVKSSRMSWAKLNMFLNTFRKMKYDFLWKWETDYLDNKPDNVRIMKWLPQQDLLGERFS